VIRKRVVTSRIRKQQSPFDINRFDASYLLQDADLFLAGSDSCVSATSTSLKEEFSEINVPDFCESARKRPAVFERRGVNGTSCGKSRKNVLAFKAVFHARLPAQRAI